MTGHYNKDDDSLVELVLPENGSLGIKIQKLDGGRVIKLLRLEETGQAAAAAKALDIDPETFIDGKIVGVDGQRYAHGGEVYTALRLINRPKRILVQLYNESHDTLVALPMQQRRRASLLRQKATFATESMRQLSHSLDEMDKMNAELEHSGGVHMHTRVVSSNGGRVRRSDSVDASPSVRARKILGFLRDGVGSTTSRFAGFHSPRGGIRKGMPARDEGGFVSLKDDSSLPLSERPEFHNLDEETQRDILKKEAREACLQAIRDHFEAFIEENPTCTYEEWIEELHPENAKSKRNLVKGHSIDHRLYTEHSDHRSIWNSKLGNGAREFVPVRDYAGAKSIRAIHEYDENHEIHAEPQVKKSFARSPPTATRAAAAAAN